MSENPPTPKYRYTLVIEANSHDEIVTELLYQTRGGYLLDSEYEKRDTFHVWGARTTSELEHLNPDMTPDRYAAELDEWWQARKVANARDADEPHARRL